MPEREKVFLAALAGLLHDVGKFGQRADVKIDSAFNKEDAGEHGAHAILSQQFVEKFVPQALRNGLSGVLYHHRQDLQEVEIARIRLADHLAAGERRTGSEEQADPKEARLIPILSNVVLLQAPPKQEKHKLAALTIDDTSSYPVEDIEGEYSKLWEQMGQELESWKKSEGWNNQSAQIYFSTLLAIFHKYLWCVPSATPWQKDDREKPYRAWPDVSLYDHVRLTSAIAACLAYDHPNKLPQESEPVALLVRGDVSGIQSFIYRLQRPDVETAHIAKRLRGRSFYVQLLTELVVDSILHELGLPESCAIFVGGGRFDLLLPIQAEEKVRNFETKLSRWLYQEFHGELALLIALEKASKSDFADTTQISQKLDEQLEQLKRRKWQNLLSIDQMAVPQGEQYHVCKVCQLTPMDDSGQICALCQGHEKIGTKLPKAKYLAFCYERPSNPTFVFPDCSLEFRVQNVIGP